MAKHITDKLVRGLDSPEKGNRIIYDDAVAGFGIRVTAAGAKSFIIQYRNAEGRDRRLTIGRYNKPVGRHNDDPNKEPKVAKVWSVEAARKRARELKKLIDLGGDPLEDRVKVLKAPTVAHLCDRYIKDFLPRKRPTSQAGDKSMIARIIRPKLGTRKVAAVKHADIDALHRALKATPYQANRVVALLSKMFSLAMRWEWRDDNPVRKLERYPEEPRKKYLKPEEIGRLTKILDDYPDQRPANVVRLCLLTGCRIGEALSARWDQLDLDAGQWVKPGATTKQKTMHDAPLSAAAVVLLKSILKDAPKADDGVPGSRYVFPGRVPEHLVDLKGPWNAIRKAAGLDGVRLHDLRHTYASILASAGASLPMIGQLLGHTKAETTLRYVHLFDDPLRKMTDEVGHVVTGTKPAEATPIRKDGVA